MYVELLSTCENISVPLNYTRVDVSDRTINITLGLKTLKKVRQIVIELIPTKLSIPDD